MSFPKTSSVRPAIITLTPICLWGLQGLMQITITLTFICHAKNNHTTVNWRRLTNVLFCLEVTMQLFLSWFSAVDLFPVLTTAILFYTGSHRQKETPEAGKLHRQSLCAHTHTCWNRCRYFRLSSFLEGNFKRFGFGGCYVSFGGLVVTASKN